MKTIHTIRLVLVSGVLCCAQAALAQQQGVSKNEILVGTVLDLSGPLAGYGKDTRNGLNLRIAEVNEHGGIHGRKVKLIVEDSGYEPKRAVLAVQKLVSQDKVFVMASNQGTAINLAAMPVMVSKGVINFFPQALGRELYEPLSKYKYAFQSSYLDAMRNLVPRLYRAKKAAKPCALYQDDEYGLEVVRGAEAGLKNINTELVERASYKRGATDFSSQMARLKAAGCDFIVMATFIRESVGAINEARKLDYNPIMMGASPAYTELIPKLGGNAMDGFYSTMTAQIPYEDDASERIRTWAKSYRAAFTDAPTVFSVYGYSVADRLIMALQKAGPGLTTDTLATAIESMSKVPADMFGTPEMSFSPTKHLGSSQVRISQIQDGRWKVVLDYADIQ